MAITTFSWITVIVVLTFCSLSYRTTGETERELRASYAESPIPRYKRTSSDEVNNFAKLLYQSSNFTTGDLVHMVEAFGELGLDGLASGVDEKAYLGLVKQLLSNKLTPPYKIGVTRYGIRYLTPKHSNADGESHPFQVVAVLGELGLDRDAIIEISPDLKEPFFKLIDDCESMFSLDGEFEWICIALLVSGRSKFKNRFGEEFSLSDTLDGLLKRRPGLGSCSGCHVIEALVFLEMLAESQNGAISNSELKTLSDYLDMLQQHLVNSQQVSGALSSNWGDRFANSSEYKNWESKRNGKFDRNWLVPIPIGKFENDVAATAHHIKWILLRKKFDKLPVSFFERSNTFLCKALRSWLDSGEEDGGRLGRIEFRCPIMHAFHAICLLNCNRTDANCKSVLTRKLFQ